MNTLIPVIFPPGRFRLAAKPCLTGSAPTARRSGSSWSPPWRRSDCRRSQRGRRRGGGRGRRQAPAAGRLGHRPSGIRSPRSRLRHNRPDQALGEMHRRGRQIGCGLPVEKPDHRHRRLLCACRERPRGRRAAEQRDERAPVHSITSSARNRNDSGIVNPSTLAVVRLIARSNLVGCSIGISPGLAPRRILAT